MKIDELDLSQFHPLDHSIWSKRCAGFYGGRRNHLKLWWDYQVPRWLTDPWGLLLCKLRVRHHWMMRIDPATMEPTGDRMCGYCGEYAADEP